VALGGLLPWTPLALVWTHPVWRFVTRRQDIETLDLRLLLWALLPFLFYSLSVGKQPRYILPVLPPLAILLATSVLERTRDWRSLDGSRVRLRRPLTIAAGAVGAGGLLVLLAALLWRATPLLINVSPVATVAAALVIGLAGASVMAVGVSGAWRQTPIALALAAAVMFPALQYGALAGRGEDTVEQVAAAVRAARTGDEPVGTHQVFVRNLVYYTGLKTVDLTTDEQLAVFLRQDARVIVVADADALARVEQEHGLALERVAAFRYFDEAGIRLRTLLQPDAARDISRVVVAVNR
jgi:4-amino-4-deoxy-L-arabinose transferase-like glycosyltransferase